MSHQSKRYGSEHSLRVVRENVGWEERENGFDEGEPDWEFFLPEEEPHPEPGDFWIDGDLQDAA